MSKLKSQLLNENFSTANAKLRKSIMFLLIQKLSIDNCYRCSLKIADIKELSVEHKTAWQSAANPSYAFYDLDNIAFSHLNCNVSAAARKGGNNRGRIKHGISGYRLGCRCSVCKNLTSIARKDKYKRNGT